MRFKQIISSKRYWKSVLVLGVLFVLVYNIGVMIISYGSLAFKQYYQDHLTEGNWIKFVIGQLLGTLVYGMIVSYGLFRKRDKQELKK